MVENCWPIVSMLVGTQHSTMPLAKVTPENTNINGIRYITFFCILAAGLSNALAGMFFISS